MFFNLFVFNTKGSKRVCKGWNFLKKYNNRRRSGRRCLSALKGHWIPWFWAIFSTSTTLNKVLIDGGKRGEPSGPGRYNHKKISCYTFFLLGPIFACNVNSPNNHVLKQIYKTCKISFKMWQNVERYDGICEYCKLSTDHTVIRATLLLCCFISSASCLRQAGLSWVIYQDRKICTVSEEENGLGIKLKDVLTFATGADRVPALRFPLQPRISFIHPEQLPTEEMHTAGLFRANTCAMEPQLPILDNYETFRDRMVMAIQMISTFARS